MDNEKEISFGAFDSELMHQEIYIPEGFEATIDGDKIILKKIESEDEKVRKALVELVKCNERSGYTLLNNVSTSSMLDWLEKQGEHKKFRDSIQVNDEVTRNRDGVIVNLSQLKRVAKKSEQKLPIEKFHEGEWVVFNDKHESVYQIEKIENFQYILRHILGGSMPLSFSHEDMIRVWTVKDARDGDVLINWNNTAFIFKTIEDETVKFHIAYNEKWEATKTPSTTLSLMGLPEPQFEFHPATKEQRDTLFAKMKEAGYEWDSEKKELKKIELSDVGHEYYSELLKNDKSDNIADYAYQCVYCMSHDWAIENPTWDNVQSACRLGAKWQKKHDVSEDWSEEDEKMIGRVRGIIEAYAFSQSAVDVNGDLCEKKFIDVDIWLKSIKERYTWKPSDEQMEALFVLLPTVSYGKNPAFSLYNDLKKLKGE